MVKRKEKMCLCSRCLSDFFEAGVWFITRDENVDRKEACDFCHTRMGWTYDLSPFRRRIREAAHDKEK